MPLTAVIWVWSDAKQDGSLTTRDPSQLGQQRGNGDSGDGTDTRSGLQHLYTPCQTAMRLDALRNLDVKIGNGHTQGLHGRIDKCSGLVWKPNHSFFDIGPLIDKKAPCPDQIGYSFAFRFNWLRRKAMQLSCEFCDHRGINGIGLCPLSDCLGKMADPRWIEHMNACSGRSELVAERSFIPTSGFKPDDRHAVRTTPRDQLLPLLRMVSSVPSGSTRKHGSIKTGFAHIDTAKGVDLCHPCLPSLWCGLTSPRNRSDFKEGWSPTCFLPAFSPGGHRGRPTRTAVASVPSGFHSNGFTRHKGGDEIGPNPTDRGKPGSKRHILVDANGIPLALRISPANRHDSKFLEALVDAVPAIRQCAGRPRRRPAKLHAGKGYDFAHCRQALRRRGIIPRIARRGIESSQRLGRHRWVVERTLAWFARFRRIAVRYERRADIFTAFHHIAAGLICWRFVQKWFC